MRAFAIPLLMIVGLRESVKLFSKLRNLDLCIVKVHPRHSQKRVFDAPRCFAAPFAHNMALLSSLPAGCFSCEHEISLQEGTSELGIKLGLVTVSDWEYTNILN